MRPLHGSMDALESPSDIEDEDELRELEDKIEKAMVDNAKKVIAELKKSEGWTNAASAWPGHWKDLVHDEVSFRDFREVLGGVRNREQQGFDSESAWFAEFLRVGDVVCKSKDLNDN